MVERRKHMYQDTMVYTGAGPTLWCAVKCAACAICLVDGPSPAADAIAAASVFVAWGGK